MAHNVILEQMFQEMTILEVAKKFDATTTSYLKYYPEVEKVLKTPAGRKAYKSCVSEFIQKRSANLYDNLPCARIFFGEDDANELFHALKIDKAGVSEAIQRTYYGNEPNFSPLAAKNEFTILMMHIIRYFLLANMKNEAELAMIHLCFSGKFYPSLHYRSFPDVVPARHIMEYTINNVLSTKYDLVSEGSVLGSVRKIGNTWMATYKNRFKKFHDEDVVYMIAQLYSRIGSFMKNIASAYYEVWNDRDDLYIAYSSDSMEEDNYHLADSDSLKVNRYTEATMNYIINNGVDYTICKSCSDVNITTNEMKSIMESLLADPKSAVKMRELIMLMITTYLAYGPSKDKDIRNPKFITYTIAPKPNAKQKELVRLNELVTEMLSENSPAFVRRKSRKATKNSFEKALKMYFALSIHNANR